MAMRNAMTEPKLFVYFDMDGVLVEFNDQDTITQPFRVPGSHYFRNQPPDAKAVDLMRCLSEFPKIKTIVLTRLLNPLAQILADEHENDKRAWCLEHALTPDFDQDGPDLPFICLKNVNDKTSVLASLPPGENKKRHILIDDDIMNLAAWKQAGGTAYQYMQPGRNVQRFGKQVLESSMPVLKMAEVIFENMP